jgi:predicted DNA-binding transcriptional regulator AlpA
MLPEALRAELKQLVREALLELHEPNAGRSELDRLLTAEEAAAMLGVTVRWLYRHAAKLPFTRRISRKNLRFSERGLRNWIAAKKPSNR